MALKLSDLNDLPSTSCTLSFIKAEKYESVKPYFFSGPLPPDQENSRTNLEYTRRDDISMLNLRGFEHVLDIDRHGFQFLKRRTAISPEMSEVEFIKSYMEETSLILKEQLNADIVFCYDYRFRKNTPTLDGDSSLKIGSQQRPDEPANTPHIDQTREGGQRRAARHMTIEERARYFDGTWRVRIINAWRPLHHEVKDAPLAFCDYFSTSIDDLVAADRVSEQYEGEIYYLKHSEKLTWYWIRDQTPDELAIFTSWDSDPKEGAAWCPHCSFIDEAAANKGLPRESVEVRTIVLNRK